MSSNGTMLWYIIILRRQLLEIIFQGQCHLFLGSMDWKSPPPWPLAHSNEYLGSPLNQPPIEHCSISAGLHPSTSLAATPQPHKRLRVRGWPLVRPSFRQTGFRLISSEVKMQDWMPDACLQGRSRDPWLFLW